MPSTLIRDALFLTLTVNALVARLQVRREVYLTGLRNVPKSRHNYVAPLATGTQAVHVTPHVRTTAYVTRPANAISDAHAPVLS